MRNIFFLLLFLTTSVFAGTEAIIKADQVDGLESVKNYMKEKAHFEKNVNGWGGYADAAGTRPVDGSGGSPTITCTRSTTTPITGDGSLIITKDAANRQGQGCSAQFTIGNEMKARGMQIEMDYRVVSGTFAAGTSTTDSDLILYIYDVTNSTLIEPTSIKFMSTSTTLPDKFIANFQTSATGTTYNLIIHQATTSASAFVLMLDNFKVTQSRYVYGTPITDNVAYTPSNSQGFGTLASVDLRWSRKGDTLSIEGGFTSGTVTGSIAQLGLPNGLTIGGTTGKRYHVGELIRAGGARVTVFAIQGNNYLTFGGGASSQGDVVGSSLVGSTEVLLISASEIPIQGWSSSTQQSDGYDARPVVLSRFNQTTQSINNAVLSIVDFPVAYLDTTASWRASSGAFNSAAGTFATTNPGYVIPTSGEYRVSAGVRFQGTVSPAANSNLLVSVYLDGVLTVDALASWQNGGSAGSNIGPGASGSATIRAKAGQVIDIRIIHSFGAAAVLDNNPRTYLSIEKLQAPTTTSATELVASIHGTTSQTITAGGTRFIVDASTKLLDTHGLVTTGASWKFTAQYPGLYEVKYVSQHASVTLTTGAGLGAELFKNGSFYKPVASYAQQAATATGPTLSGSVNVWLNSTEYIDVREAVGGSVNAVINDATIYITKIK